MHGLLFRAFSTESIGVPLEIAQPFQGTLDFQNTRSPVSMFEYGRRDARSPERCSNDGYRCTNCNSRVNLFHVGIVHPDTPVTGKTADTAGIIGAMDTILTIGDVQSQPACAHNAGRVHVFGNDFPVTHGCRRLIFTHGKRVLLVQLAFIKEGQSVHVNDNADPFRYGRYFFSIELLVGGGNKCLECIQVDSAVRVQVQEFLLTPGTFRPGVLPLADMVEKGRIAGARKNIDKYKIVATIALGTKKPMILSTTTPCVFLSP